MPLSKLLTVRPQYTSACDVSATEMPRRVIENTRVRTAYLVGVACGAPSEPIDPGTAGMDAYDGARGSVDSLIGSLVACGADFWSVAYASLTQVAEAPAQC